MKTKVVLTRGERYKLPVSKKIVVSGEPVEVDEFEWERIAKTGRFNVLPENVEESEFPGLLSVSGNEPSPHLSEDWTNKKIFLKMIGGMGDTLIAASVARKLKERDCFIVMCVREGLVGLISSLEGIDKVISIKEFNERVGYLTQFDLNLDLAYSLTVGNQQIVDKDYYTAMYEKAGLPIDTVVLPRLLLHKEHRDRLRKKMPQRPIVAIHTGASNPIRRWDNDYWRRLSTKLTEKGCSIVWLGHDDFALEDTNMVVADSFAIDPLDQAGILWQCEYFIGNDSGYAHLAGLMGIPGLVIFSATKPDHVIGRYKSLRSIDVFSETGNKPSRNLKNQDPVANACMRLITPERVMSHINNSLFAYQKSRPKEVPQPLAKDDREIRRAQVVKHTRVLAILPHLIMGGGERMMIGLLRNLSKWFMVDAVGLHQSTGSIVSDVLSNELDAAINGKLHIFHPSQEFKDLNNLLESEDYDVVLYYGWNNDITRSLREMKKRPITIRIAHTSQDIEAVVIEHSRKQIDHLICVSKKMATRLGGTWIPNAVDTSRFKGAEAIDLGFSKKRTTLGYVGRIDSLKGIYKIVDFAKTMDFNFAVVGGKEDDKETKFLKRMIEENRLADKIKVFPQDTDVEKYYKAIDAYVLLSDTEGMPLGVIEAAYCGKPSIATTVGSIPDIFRDKETIFFCNKQPEDFKRCLELVQMYAPIVGEAAQKLVTEKYTDAVQAEAYRKTIRYVMGRTWPDKVRQGTIRLKRSRGAGDLIMATSVIPKVREMFPDAKIQFELPKELHGIVKNHPSVDNIQEEYTDEADILFNLTYYDCWKFNGRAINAMGGNEYEMELILPEPSDALKHNFKPFSTGRLRKAVGFWTDQNYQSLNKTKEWPDENWSELASRLRKEGLDVYHLGAMWDRKRDFADDARQVELEDSLLCLVPLDVVVSIDCVAQHATKALDLPTIVIWGGSASPDLIGYDSHVNIVTKDNHKCLASVCASTYQSETCCGDGSCMKGVTVDDVFKAVMFSLEHRKLNYGRPD